MEIYAKNQDNERKLVGDYDITLMLKNGTEFCVIAYILGIAKILSFDPVHFYKDQNADFDVIPASNCAICLNNFSEAGAALNPCGHAFCSVDCANTQWGNKCPLCKKQVIKI